MTGRKPKTAAELMAELEGDEAWVQRREESDAERQSELRQNRLDAAPVLAAVAEIAGVEADSISELRELSSPAVVAVLIDWLPQVDNVQVKRDIASALGNEWARPAAAVPLLAAFDATAGDGAKDGLRWSIASALSEVADSSVTHRIIQLVLDRRNGSARQMLTIALGRSSDMSAVPVLVELLADYEVAGHAGMALSALQADETRSEIEKLQDDDRSWVRDEVRRALADFR